jgi:Sec-independent protein translocase protein TatA
MELLLGIVFFALVGFFLFTKRKPEAAAKVVEGVKAVETAVVEEVKAVETAVVEEVKEVVKKARKPRATAAKATAKKPAAKKTAKSKKA